MRPKYSFLLVFAILFLTKMFANTDVSTNEETFTNAKVEIKGSDIEKSLFIEFANSKEEDVTISIMNEEGATVHIDKAKSIKAFNRKFNLEKLERGKYTLKFVCDNCKVTQLFEVSKKGISVKENDRKEVYAPVVKQEDGKFDVKIGIIKTKYAVLVLDLNGNIVFEESEKGVNQLNKKYNLSNLAKGEYLFQITVDGESYYHNFNK
jgi:cytochrome c1